MSDYFAMGGYAGYIWPAYGVTAAVMIGLAVYIIRGYRQRQALLRDLQDQAPAGRRDGAA